jgi:hypothetical protein
MSEITIREYAPGDEHEILKTFNLVFRETCGPGFVDRGMERWEWQFRRNPMGTRIMLAVAGDGTVACQYAGVPVRAHTRDGDVVFDQGVDSMVHPGFRRGLKKDGIFIPSAYAYFDRWGFSGGCALIYGYPVSAPWRIGQKYFEQKLVRVVDYLIRPAELGAASGPAGVEVVTVRRFGPDADRLWDEAKAELACAVTRDARYLDWRYADCPDVEYELLVARRAGVARGLAVLNATHEVVPGACTIADWLVPGGDRDVARALLAAATRTARARGRAVVMAVASEPHALHRFLLAEGFVATPSAAYLERRLGLRSFAERFTPEWVAEHWYYTLGDSDLV